MIGIHGYKWTTQYGLIYTEDGKLSGMAKEWQRGLTGITLDQIRNGFEGMTAEIMRSASAPWPPSWPQFRNLCLSKFDATAPTLDETVSVLVIASSRKGTLAQRYRHPLILAVSLEVDMHSLRTAKLVDARRMVKPVYERLLNSGWNDWPEHAHDDVIGLTHEKPKTDKAIAKAAFKNMKVLVH
jgi:hypothetical protein